MIFLEKSELPSSKYLSKNYIPPSPEKFPITFKKSHTPIYIPISPCTLLMFFFLSNFLYLKKNDNAQLCTDKIEAIPSNNIENRP